MFSYITSTHRDRDKCISFQLEKDTPMSTNSLEIAKKQTVGTTKSTWHLVLHGDLFKDLNR